jgi:putative ABC transport system substrate-binding protein
MNRRNLIALLGGAAAWPVAARAQQSSRVWHIGVLGAVPLPAASLSAFRDSLREHGYIEGQNLRIDVRWPKETFEREPVILTDLLRSNVDIIVAWATPP